jgi:hypothetical protein
MVECPNCGSRVSKSGAQYDPRFGVRFVCSGCGTVSRLRHRYAIAWLFLLFFAVALLASFVPAWLAYSVAILAVLVALKFALKLEEAPL